MRNRDRLYRQALAVADLVAAATAVFLGVSAFGDETLEPQALLLLPLVTLLCKAVGLYDRDENLVTKTTLDEAPRLLQVATFCVLVLWLGESALVEADVDGAYLAKQQIVSIWGLLIVALVLSRYFARRLARVFATTERCLVLGDPRSATRIHAKLAGDPASKAMIVGRVELSDERRKEGGPARLGTMDTLGLVLAENDVHRVIIAPRSTDSAEILHAIRLVRSMGVKASVLPRMFEVVGSSVEFDEMDGLPLLGIRRGGLSQSSRALKRAMDLLAGGVGLLLILPLMSAIALAVKAGSRGPVFFRQSRIGRDGKVFWMLKFRSMVDGADARKAELLEHNEAAGGFFKIADDPRVTRVGRILRRTYLDELPQLLNVLKGDMSLVGPRPLVPEEDGRVEGHYRSRLLLTPGMTGVWQVLGSSSRVPIDEMVKIDYLYGANWSPWLDIKILLRTVSYALSRKGL